MGLGSEFDDGFGMGFRIIEVVFPIAFFIIFAIMIGIIIYAIVSKSKEVRHNNNSPVLTVVASVVARRTEVRGGGNVMASTSYYVTFQVESGDRFELQVKSNEYGQLVEGDFGNLTFQGNRYIGFQRVNN